MSVITANDLGDDLFREVHPDKILNLKGIEKMSNLIKTNTERIPVFLRRIAKWASFRFEDGKKKPISLIDGYGVGPADTDRLVDFETAKAAYNAGAVAAIGVSLDGEEITCIDIDCHEEGKRDKFEELNEEILSQFPSYAETSISGCGTHIFVNGTKPEGYKHCDKHGIIEVYDCSRFMVCTGNVIEGHDTYLATCQDQLNELCEKHLIKQINYTGIVGTGVYTKSDEEVLDKIRNNKKGSLFLEGRWNEIERWDDTAGTYIQAFPSQSEADFSFASLLLYFGGNNPDQAQHLFLKSAMWNEKRKAKKSSGYVQHTIAEASLRCSRVYDWDRYSYTQTEQAVDFDEVMQTYTNNILLVQAQNNTLCLTANKELNDYLSKYIINFGSQQKEVMRTTHGDYDASDNGVRFWLLNNQDLIYLEDGDEWLAWNGKYWNRYYDDNLLWYATRVFTQLKHEAYNFFQQSILAVDLKDDLEDKALALFKYASTRKNVRPCMEMIKFSKKHFITTQQEQRILEKVKANINVINLENGVFDLDNMKFLPHSREFYQTRLAGCSYEEAADCPLWVGFLETVLPSEEVRRYFQKTIGYTISSGYMEKCMFILYGENGDNGKTTIVKTIHKLMGDYGAVAEKQTIMDTRGHNAGAPRPDLVRLRGKRYICVSENEKEDRLAEGLVKNLTGGGMINCRTLQHEPIEFPALFKIFLDTNYRPQLKGTDRALFNRLKILSFDVTIPPEKIDLHFGEKLEKELSGILNWAIEGYRLYGAEGLAMPEEMQQLVRDYAEDMSTLDQWLKECVEINVTGIKVSHTSKELFQSYKNWCIFNSEYAWTQRKFTQEINRKEGFKEVKKVQGYTKYMNVGLNVIGSLCAIKDTYTDSDFIKKYNELVRGKFAAADHQESFGQFAAEPPKD